MIASFPEVATTFLGANMPIFVGSVCADAYPEMVRQNRAGSLDFHLADTFLILGKRGGVDQAQIGGIAVLLKVIIDCSLNFLIEGAPRISIEP